jgi:hypothetical protein
MEETSTEVRAPINCVISLRVGTWGNSTLRKRKNLDDILGISITERTSVLSLTETIKTEFPANFQWDSTNSVLRYSPIVSGPQSGQRPINDLLNDETMTLYDGADILRTRFLQRQPANLRNINLFKLQLWIYGSLRVSSVQQVIRRAGPVRIAEQMQRIANFNQAFPENALGRMQSSHVSRVLARLPPEAVAEDLTPETLPNRDATSRQMAHLDAQIQNLQSEPRDNALAEIFINLNNVRVPIMIEVESLRKALGLPNINLNGLQNFNDPIVPLQGEDLRDLDHGDE